MSTETEALAKFTTSAALSRPELRAAAASMTADQFETFLTTWLADNAENLVTDGLHRGLKAINTIADRLTGAACYDSSEYDRIHRDRFARHAYRAMAA